MNEKSEFHNVKQCVEIQQKVDSEKQFRTKEKEKREEEKVFTKSSKKCRRQELE